MKKLILVIAIYLTGYVFAYKYTKFNLTEFKNGEWTKGDRTFALWLSSGSWITVASMGLTHAVSSIDNNEKAEW